MTLPLEVGSRVQLRKAHPCGSVEWVVYRVGADVGLRCAGCGRQIMLTRRVFNQRVKQVLAPETTMEKEDR
ncbi:MAG: DUF951 domain-containing protein [Anaerolineae bacterium]|nr:DUF951 domain-containing protein [Anaerolineae bacterium]